LVRNVRAIVTITVVFLILQIAVILALAYQGRPDYMRSVAGTTVFMVVYTFLEARYGLIMNNYVRVLVMLAILIDGLFGYCFNLYTTSAVFDKVLHIFGTYAFALFFYVLVVQMIANPVVKPVKFILAACLGLSIGASYEILEFFTDSLSHPSPPSQPSLWDTNTDLISDAVGALLAAVHVVFRTFINRDF
jgi:uncharacterized membrane protein YjdF